MPVWNPTPLVRWNLSKRYLLELAEAGVPTVPTVVLEGDAAAQLPAALAQRGWASAVVKPLVSASAHDTVLIRNGDVAPVVEALTAGTIRQPVLVQPFVEEIVNEPGLAFTHAPAAAEAFAEAICRRLAFGR